MSSLVTFGGGGGSGTVTSVSGGTNINATGTAADPIINLDAALVTMDTITFNTGGALRTGVTNADTLLVQAYDVDGAVYTTFATLTAANTPTMDLDDAVTKAGSYIYRVGGTDVSVADGGTGTSTLLDNGVLVGSGAAAITSLAVGTNGQLLIGSTGADPVFASPTSTSSTLTYTTGAGTLNIDLSSNVQNTAISGWNGSLLETAAVSAASDGATITFSVEQSGGGDLTAVFSDGYYAWDTTPADTVTLTAGSDTSPQINYVYLLQSTKTLTAATGGWPATEHAPLATVLCQSAASFQTDGAYKFHAWTDHVTQTNNQGHIGDINFWIRQQNATWKSGVGQTLTITPNGGAADNVIFTSASGVVLQLHNQTFPAFAGTPDIYTVNDSVTPYNVVTDLNALLTDSAGVSMSGRYFSLVIWGVVSEDSGDCKLMVNLPSGSYNNSAAVTTDASKFADFSIPVDFKGTGFLIAQYNLRHQAAASGTWTEIDFIDLRGLFPASTGGSGTATSSEFIDNVFRILDDGDNSKEIAFQASGITTATTRTITMADRDVDLNNILPWSEETGTSVAMTVNSAYTANNAGLVTLTLPDTAAYGSRIRVSGKGAGLFRIAQNAGETIHFGSSTTTTGVGGYIEATLQYDVIELLCITADVQWLVLSSVGNLTVV